MDGAQLVDGRWFRPMFGCDSLQNVIDRIRKRPAQEDLFIGTCSVMKKLVHGWVAEIQWVDDKGVKRGKMFGVPVAFSVSQAEALAAALGSAPAMVAAVTARIKYSGPLQPVAGANTDQS